MRATVTIDTREFQSAMRQYLAVTKRTLEEAVRTRLFYLLIRVFLILKPRDPQAARNRIRDYLNAPIGERRFDRRTGKRVGRSRMLQRRHLIAQMLQRKAGGKGLYGEEMKAAAGKLSRQSIGSVGYLKSVVAKAIKAINGHFTQFGRQVKDKLKAGQRRRESRQVAGNQALIDLAGEYGHHLSGNVALHKGAKAFAFVTKGWSPTAVADMAIAIANGQEGNVAANYNPAFAQAFRDEAAEMRRHLASRMQEDANRFMVNPLPVP